MHPKCISHIQITAERFKEMCLNNDKEENSAILNDLLTDIFDPEKGLNTDLNNVSKIIGYLSGGLDFEEFKAKIKHYDNSTVCGLVWNTHYVAYRCRTCGISPCMSLCADCFKNGDHVGHDFNMFRSGAGGACDCGDEHVMLKNGFCKYHRHDRQSSPEAPSELTKCGEIILSNLLYRILQYFRSVYLSENDEIRSRQALNDQNDAQSYLDFLNELCCLGTTIRRILVKYMLSSEFYTKKINEENLNYENKLKTQTSTEAKYLHRNFLDKSTEIDKNIRIPDEFKNIILTPKYTNILNEFLFWCIKFEFPENLVKFLLSLLPEQEYKVEFTRSFVTHYMYISTQILTNESEQLSSRVVHISVQLFSNELITKIALEEYTLLPIFISTLYNIITSPSLLKLSNIQDNKQTTLISPTKHFVVDPDNTILQSNLYWPAISDLVNLLTHKTIAINFLENSTVFNLWLYLINRFQAMNLNERQLYTHIQYDQPTYFSSFSAELEFCSSIIWSFVQHLNSETTLNLSLKCIKLIEKNLFKWFEIIGMKSVYYKNIIRPNPNQLSFHLPVHRFYSILLYNSLFKQNAKLHNLLIFDDLNLINLIAYPLQAQIGYYEIHANMWVRNGLQMKGQAMTYVQNHFSSSFNDADLFLIQLILCKFNNYELLMQILFQRFYLNEFFRIKSPDSSISANDTEMIKIDNKYDMLGLDVNQQNAMLSGLLTFLIELICIKPNLELQNYSLTRKEIINLLCVGDRTYSQIEESLPDICSLSTSKREVGKVISEVADYKQPSFEIYTKGLRQGYYVPKDFVWLNEYDPLYTLLRSVKQREYQDSFDRYCEFIKTKNLNKDVVNKLWPPLRLPKYERDTLDYELLLLKLNILETKNLHGLLFTMLYKHFYETALPEKCLYFVIFTLELALYKKELKNEEILETTDESMGPAESQECYKEMNYEEWFNSNNILKNLCKEIPSIQFDEPIVKESNDNSSNKSSLPFFVQNVASSSRTSFSSSTASNQTEEQKTSPNSTVKQDKKTLEIGESILSLLVKIMHKHHHKNTGSRVSESDSDYSVSASSPGTSSFLSSQVSVTEVPLFKFKNENSESRIGDEFYFISNILNKAALLSNKCRRTIEKALEKITTKSVVVATDDEDEAKRKKAKARARQMKLMEKMASHQQAFLSKTNVDINLDEDVSETKQSLDEDMSIPQKTYDCCICRTSSIPSSERPIGVIALLQSSNVLGYRDTTNSTKQIPLNNDEKINTKTMCWSLEETRSKFLSNFYANSLSRYATNIGWKGGVFTQTCGHYLHFDCYNSYKETVSLQQPNNFSSLINGEFFCPLCRQIANCLLPIMDFSLLESSKLNLDNLIDKSNEDHAIKKKSALSYSAEIILNLLKNRDVLGSEITHKTSNSKRTNTFSMVETNEDEDSYIEPLNITAAVKSLLSFLPESNNYDRIQSLISVLRTQLEIILLLKEQNDNMMSSNLKRSCFLPLFDVVSTHIRNICNNEKLHVKLWFMLTNPNSLNSFPENQDNVNFPLIFYDPVSLLLIILVNLPARVHISIYRKIINFIFNLVYRQSILALIVKLDDEKLERVLNGQITEQFKAYFESMILKLKNLRFFEFVNQPVLNLNLNSIDFDERNVQSYVESLCLPFLKIASLLQYYLYEQEFDLIDTFHDLVTYLQINYNNIIETHENQLILLDMPFSCFDDVLDVWLKDLAVAIKNNSLVVNGLLQMKEIVYNHPNLLKLPPMYSDIFSYYSQKKCNFCSKVPREPAVCLVCGEHLCYRAACCCDDMRNYIKDHLNNCGSGTILMLNINSTYIHIVRAKRSASWASLYLDKHGEEDRDLKRGKPLYLSQQRYEVLRSLWISHAFDHQNIRWYNTNLFIN